ncbi:MAG: hypothetical protein CMJ74_03700 [Planctomycetaceae bacterium]|nr:hypothetical protein [Planctomycetaceae bacterium]
MVPIQITAFLLAAAGAGETVLYDFQASWCGPCKMMAPVVHQLSTEGYPVREIDIDRDVNLARKFGVTNIPCFVLVVDGQERGRIIGATNHQRLAELFSAAGVLPATAQSMHARGQSPERPRKLLPLTRQLFSRPSQKHTSSTHLDVPRVALGQPVDAVQARQSGDIRNSIPPRPLAPPKSRTEIVEHSPLQMLGNHLLRSSVRLKVYDPQGHSLGSGTIIDSWTAANGVSEALILTCGHIFRDSAGEGKIEVDLFDRSGGSTLDGVLVRYDLQNDIGLVAIHSDYPLRAIPLIDERQETKVGEMVLSVGCDHGNDPTVQYSTVKAINSFVGPPNLQVEGQPAVGRSGGGLFNQRGELIGICNFADPTDRAGLYGAAQLAHAMLREINPANLVSDQHTEDSLAAENSVPEALAMLAENNSKGVASQELICIVRTGHGSESRHQVLVIDNASKDLLEQITAEHSQKDRTFPTSMAVDADQRWPTMNRSSEQRNKTR